MRAHHVRGRNEVYGPFVDGKSTIPICTNSQAPHLLLWRWCEKEGFGRRHSDTRIVVFLNTSLAAAFPFPLALLFCRILASRYNPCFRSLLDERSPLIRKSSTIVSGNHDYDSAPSHHHQAPPPNNPADISSPTSSSTGAPSRYAQHFYPTYPHQSAAAGSTAPMPSVPDSMDPMPHPQHPSSNSLASPATANNPKDGQGGRKRAALFGDIPEAKRRKFILVQDGQRDTRVRVRVTLDQINMDEIPDQQRQINSVYPRSYFDSQVADPSASPRTRMGWDDFDDEADGAPSTTTRTMVPVKLLDDTQTDLPVPRMTTSRRNKELALNELGYRMSWGQARTFHGRTLFLQRSRKSHEIPPCLSHLTNISKKNLN